MQEFYEGADKEVHGESGGKEYSDTHEEREPYHSRYDSYRFQTPPDVPVSVVRKPAKSHLGVKIVLGVLVASALIGVGGFFAYGAATGRSFFEDVRHGLVGSGPTKNNGSGERIVLGAPKKGESKDKAQEGSEDAAAVDSERTEAASGAAEESVVSDSAAAAEDGTAEESVNADSAAAAEDEALEESLEVAGAAVAEGAVSEGSAKAADEAGEEMNGEAAEISASADEAAEETAQAFAAEEEASEEVVEAAGAAAEDAEKDSEADETERSADGAAAETENTEGAAPETDGAAAAGIVPTQEDFEGRGAYLGITCMTMPESYTENGFPAGVYVMDVNAEGPADDGGICEGDILTSMDEIPLVRKEDLIEGLTRYAAGDKVTISISRYNEEEGSFDELSAAVVLGDRSELGGDASGEGSRKDKGPAAAGEETEPVEADREEKEFAETESGEKDADLGIAEFEDRDAEPEESGSEKEAETAAPSDSGDTSGGIPGGNYGRH